MTDSNSSGLAPNLPDVPGPKLPPFTPTAFAQIKFIGFLGNEDDVDSYVWKVKIKVGGSDDDDDDEDDDDKDENDDDDDDDDGDGGDENWKVYALKMFHCSPLGNHYYMAKDFACDLTEEQFIEGYGTAFGAECRAYGRLKEKGREDLAAKAHGYLLVTADQQIDLHKKWWGYEPVDNELDHLWNRKEEFRNEPIRAIVKELVTAPVEESYLMSFRTSDVKMMWEDLEALHGLGIVVRDINYFNYLEGKLIDFSRSRTAWHPEFDGCDGRDPRSLFKEEVKNDVAELFNLVEDYRMLERVKGDEADKMIAINHEFIDRLVRDDNVRVYEHREEEELVRWLEEGEGKDTAGNDSVV
ncbi:kinetochore Sim4 complex subunit FTA2-domain-containing protein [Cladorrhinum sp. PSN259]|nr:kinetochore Sim4 complex subunit FTA2-domain-containing protein [Cladorrhinum sp. PSN259]